MDKIEQGKMPGRDVASAPALDTKPAARTRKPSMYRVLLLNDDYTPMDFVVGILEKIFSKSRDEAIEIMLNVHHNGMGICGIYTFDVAGTKVDLVMSSARKAGHPLRCVMEKV